MTEQEIINEVWHFMKVQGEQSISAKTEMCSYRSEDGKKCAVGCLLEDGECPIVNDTLDVRRIDLPHRLAPHVNLLFKLQNAHDNSDGDFWPEFSAQVRGIAESHGCTVPDTE